MDTSVPGVIKALRTMFPMIPDQDVMPTATDIKIATRLRHMMVMMMTNDDLDHSIGISQANIGNSGSTNLLQRLESSSSSEPLYNNQEGVYQSSSMFQSNQNLIVPPNPYLNIEIPKFLRVYSRAPLELDHQLRWELFRLPELECFNALLNRLYREELEELVMGFEEYRNALLKEIDSRQQQIANNNNNNNNQQITRCTVGASNV